VIHDLSPFIFKVTETFGPRWYGFSYMLGFVCAYFLVLWLSERQQAGLTRELVSDFITYCAFGTMIGGRLGYCVFYDPELLWSTSWSFPFWKVLAVWEGGMASHGGIIGIVTACWLFGRKHRINWVYLVDVISIVGPVGVFFGRIANFINGELVGRVAPESFKFGVRFPTDIMNWPSYEFDRLQSLGPVVEKINTAGGVVTSSQWTELVSKFKTEQPARDQVYQLLGEVINAIQHGNEAAKAAIGPLLDYRYPSQLFAAGTEGLFTFLILFFIARRSRHVGFISGSFIICYAAVRIFNEMFRMPDLQIGYQLFGLTRGQWLSIVMMAIGLVMIIYWRLTQSQMVHGWQAGENVKLGNRKIR
jgi:phosphatidylglycerol---prolipoprotein diacylglyceryl transferase